LHFFVSVILATMKNEHSCEEIAKMVDCPTNTVKSRMYHGRLNMQRLLPRLAGFETG